MKACVECRMIIKDGKVCPSCGSNKLTEKFQGKIMVLNQEKSEIAKVVGINAPGPYAITVG